LTDASRIEAVRYRLFDLAYLIAIAIAMIGWSWLLIEGLNWALDI
jgi:hypothetical protein